MGIHNGHRARMKQEFLSAGLSGFSEVRVLEFLLFFTRSQGDVNPTAHHLLNEFGSLSGVLDADYDDLLAINGVGEHTAILLKLIPAVSARYLASRTNDVELVRDSRDLQRLFAPYFFGARNEMSFLACLDAKKKVLGVRKLSEGGPNQTELGPRQIAAAALSMNATFVVLAHNHTSGVATPSQADISTTLHLHKVLAGVGVTLYDHVVMADDDMVSLRDSGCFQAFF